MLLINRYRRTGHELIKSVKYYPTDKWQGNGSNRVFDLVHGIQSAVRTSELVFEYLVVRACLHGI